MRQSLFAAIFAVAFVASSVGLLAPSLQAGAAAQANPLFPLSERDMSDTKESGCVCTFNRGRATLVQMMGNEFMIRTRAGRQACRITDRQFGNFSVRTPITCAGKTFTLRHTGRAVEHPEADSVETPSALTISQGRARTVLNGMWGCAC